MTDRPRPPAALSSSPGLEALVLVTGLGAVLGGCVSVSDIAVVSASTALEEQAAGDYPALENELSDASLHPRAEGIPREDLVAADEAQGLGVVAALYAQVATDLDRLDQLLRAGCVGEGTDGLLVHRPDEPCGGEVDPSEVARLVGRANVHRRQVWEHLAEASPAEPDEVRATWRAVHQDRVVCGAAVQAPDGTWARKTCDR